MEPLPAVLSRQLHFVSGKGGVGKSLVACTLARAFRAQGLSVLLCQVHANDSHARLLGSRPIGAELVDVEPQLGAVNIEPQAALKEYALMTLRFEALYRTVFENRLTKVFLRFVPSMNELTMAGKIWFHAEERLDGGRPRWDRIVVDCPSTGHALKLLQVSQAIRDTSRVGPMYEKTRAMADVFADPRRSAVHVVAIPEELPVNEANDLIRALAQKKTAPLGAVFMNQVLTTLFSERVERSLGRLVDVAHAGDGPLRHLLEVAERRRQRERLEVVQRTRVLELGAPVVELPMVLPGPLGADHVRKMATLVLDKCKVAA